MRSYEHLLVYQLLLFYSAFTNFSSWEAQLLVWRGKTTEFLVLMYAYKTLYSLILLQCRQYSLICATDEKTQCQWHCVLFCAWKQKWSTTHEQRHTEVALGRRQKQPAVDHELRLARA